jgi:hypothetical protein
MSARNSQAMISPTLPFCQNRRTATRTIPSLALYAGLIAGTAGAFTSSNLDLVTSVNVRQLTELKPLGDKRVISLLPILSKIKSVFGLTMTEFAAVFGVARPTVYSWFSGTRPKGELQDKLWQLHRVAKEVESLQIARIDLLKKRPSSSGRTILKALTDGEGMDEMVDELRISANSTIAKLEASAPRRRQRIYTAEDISITQHGEL